jgi:hypothetical protein
VAFISVLVAVQGLFLWMRRRGTGPQVTVKHVIVLMLAMVLSARVSAQSQAPGSNGPTNALEIYALRCARCHDAGVPRAASRAALVHMSAETIRTALT